MDHQGILPAVIVEKGPDYLKAEFLIENQRPLVRLSHFSPKLLSRQCSFGFLKEGCCDTFPTVLRMDGKRDEMTILCNDEIAEDFDFLLFFGRSYIYKEAFRVKPVKVKEG